MSFDLKAALNGLFMKGKYTVDKDYSQFAVNTYLGKYKQYIPILNKIMCLRLSNQAHYNYLKKNIGYGWPSKFEIPVEKPDKMIEYLMQYYECSRLDAKDYILFITDQEKEKIKYYYEGDFNAENIAHR